MPYDGWVWALKVLWILALAPMLVVLVCALIAPWFGRKP